MRSFRGIVLVLLVCMFLGPFAVKSSADTTTLIFNVADLGNPANPTSNIGSPPYATVTLTVEGDGSIFVQGTTAPSTTLLFDNQGSAPGIFAFNINGSYSGINITNCSTSLGGSSCTGDFHSGPAFDGLGQFQYGVSDGSAVSAFQTFSFYITTTTAGGFGSVTDIEKPGTYDGDTINFLTDFASNVCVAGTTTPCAPNPLVTNGILHNYVGVTPEPASCLLFGTGLLSFAGILRRKFTA